MRRRLSGCTWQSWPCAASTLSLGLIHMTVARAERDPGEPAVRCSQSTLMWTTQMAECRWRRREAPHPQGVPGRPHPDGLHEDREQAPADGARLPHRLQLDAMRLTDVLRGWPRPGGSRPTKAWLGCAR